MMMLASVSVFVRISVCQPPHLLCQNCGIALANWQFGQMIAEKGSNNINMIDRSPLLYVLFSLFDWVSQCGFECSHFYSLTHIQHTFTHHLPHDTSLINAILMR